MLGALAWQVKNPNKKFSFLCALGGERTGCFCSPGSPHFWLLLLMRSRTLLLPLPRRLLFSVTWIKTLRNGIPDELLFDPICEDRRQREKWRPVLTSPSCSAIVLQVALFSRGERRSASCMEIPADIDSIHLPRCFAGRI